MKFCPEQQNTQFPNVKMLWEVHIVTSVTLLALLQGHKHSVSGSQESTQVIECLREITPSQIYSECCYRENNCTVIRQQNRAIDCMSRIIMANQSSIFSESRENGPVTTESSYAYSWSSQWYNDVTEEVWNICRRQPRTRQQTCIRNELVKKCRYGNVQDRYTSSYSGRWLIRNPEGDSYGRHETRRGLGTFYGNRRHPDGYFVMARPSENSETRYYTRGRYNDEMDDDDYGTSESDRLRYL